MTDLVHEFIVQRALQDPGAAALDYQEQKLNYAALAGAVESFAGALLGLGLQRSERVAVYLEKRPETVVSLFGAAAAGGVFVPVNPLLKPEQLAYILGDCNVRILVTSSERLHLLAGVLPQCRDLHTVILVGQAQTLPHFPGLPALHIVPWQEAIATAGHAAAHRTIDSDMAAILYTSGSTGRPKGVVLSHRNLVAGARSVASYLENTPADRMLSVLPLSFDYGLSQLTTAFCSGASVVLMNYLFPRDIVNAVSAHAITGLAAVPPLWIQLGQQTWPYAVSLRYITNSGGVMPRSTLALLRSALPAAKVYLMYGLTEAFRSTYLPPSELDRRPDSIGKAIPNAEVLVVRKDGTPCAADEPGELVHRGALVAMGYWNDAGKTAERFKPAPGQADGLPLSETAVWSGDTVRMDDEGFLYFIGREDDMIKVSGYRLSPTEVEEVVQSHSMVKEAAAVGVPHPVLGQAVIVIAVASEGSEAGTLTPQLLIKECQRKLPAYMVPAKVDIWHEDLPRNPNGKIDRKFLQTFFSGFFEDESKL